MLLKDNKKNIVTIIMNKYKSSSSGSDEMLKPSNGVESDSKTALDNSASKVLKSIESKNASDLSNALQEFFCLVMEEKENLEPAESEEY